jgi:hypothetical protein
VPCETQQPPDLSAPTQLASSGLIDNTSTTSIAPTSAMAPDVAKLHENAVTIMKREASAQARQKKGLPFVDPLEYGDLKTQERAARQIGLTFDGPNLVDLKSLKK